MTTTILIVASPVFLIAAICLWQIWGGLVVRVYTWAYPDDSSSWSAGEALIWPVVLVVGVFRLLTGSGRLLKWIGRVHEVAMPRLAKTKIPQARVVQEDEP